MLKISRSNNGKETGLFHMS